MKIKSSFRPRRTTTLLLAQARSLMEAGEPSRPLLRAKIEEDPRNPAFIQTIRDSGYRFEAPP